jgi:cell division protein FtsI/penicillin-binding protein 2
VARKTFQCVPLAGGRVGNKVRGWGKPIRDDVQDTTPHGEVALEKGLVVSCNAYFAQLGTYEVGPDELLQTTQLLGITAARPNTAEQLRDALPQASYGQGQVIATPFKMARVAATVARGGTMAQGQWVGDDSEPKKTEPVAVLSSGSTALIARSMREVVTRGTASRILGGIEPPVAGKTGTAEVQGKRSHSWFVGYAPYDLMGEREGGRRIAFAVIIEHGGYGGRLAAQATGEIVKAASALGLFNPEKAPEQTPQTESESN